MLIQENINHKFKGQFSFYKVDSDFSLAFQEKLLKHSKEKLYIENFFVNELAHLKPDFQIQNQILQNGLRIWNRNLQSVSRIIAGYVPDTIIPSTFTDQQTLQNPLENLKFTRVGAWEETVLSNGLKYTYSFVRPASSEGGSIINEMSIQVVDGLSVANLNRVWAPSNGLPYTFPPKQDTIGLFELTEIVS